MSPRDWTAREIREAVAAGRLSATEICRSCLSRIDELDRELGAFLHIDREGAVARAREIDELPAERRAALPLAGVPIAIKDVICVGGAPATAGSKMLERFVPPYDATVVDRLRAAGAIVLGKTNCDEFAMGSSTENSAYQLTRNPWRRDAIPGGSSGGSAVAVGARMAPVALGTDTGGSVRQPAALCGVVGLKPTYGRVSRYGLIAFASSLDQIGPFARTAYDAALVLAVIAGADAQDSTAAPEEVPDFPAALTGEARGLTIGVPRALLDQGVDPEILRCFDASLETLRSLGVTLTDIQLPHAQYAIPTYYLVATAEASSNLARYDGVRYGVRAPAAAGTDLRRMYERTRDQGFGAEVKRRIMLGTYVLSAGYYEAYYLQAQKVRTLIRQDYVQAFERVDAVAIPTSPTPAFRIGERVDDPLQMYLADVFTVSVNLAGLPGISVPCGFTRDGLPAGLQLVGRMFDEATLLRAADAYERVTEWWKAEPAVSVPSGEQG